MEIEGARDGWKDGGKGNGGMESGSSVLAASDSMFISHRAN